jgi:hypothetical protein
VHKRSTQEQKKLSPLQLQNTSNFRCSLWYSFQVGKEASQIGRNILLSSVPDENARVDAASFGREADRNADEHMSETDSTVPAFRP